jgi:hypothetical protein
MDDVVLGALAMVAMGMPCWPITGMGPYGLRCEAW